MTAQRIPIRTSDCTRCDTAVRISSSHSHSRTCELKPLLSSALFLATALLCFSEDERRDAKRSAVRWHGPHTETKPIVPFSLVHLFTSASADRAHLMGAQICGVSQSQNEGQE